MGIYWIMMVLHSDKAEEGTVPAVSIIKNQTHDYPLPSYKFQNIKDYHGNCDRTDEYDIRQTR